MTLREFTARAVPADKLVSLLAPEQWRWFYGERMEMTVLTWLEAALAAEVPPARWDHARAFDEDSELAWWRERDGHFHLRLLTAGQPPNDVTWEEGEQWYPIKEAPIATLLHGDLDVDGNGPPTWSEARIPRSLAYPVPVEDGEEPPHRVALVTEPLHRGDEVVALTRLVAVSDVKEEVNV